MFLRKNHLLWCWGWLSPLNWTGALTLSLQLKLPPRKLEHWFVLALYLYKNTVAMSALMLLVATWNCWISYKKWICQTVGPSVVASLEPLTHHWNVASLSYFCRYYFGRCSSELTELVPLSYSQGRSTRYPDRLHDFSVTTARCYKDVYINSFFPCRARLWNSLPIECFPLTYDLGGIKSRIDRNLLTIGSF